ncbi:MAG: glycosyltransferase [Lactobacillus sp.]|jgi:poly(glycerol-phosphate) alpha-glucosyltransferase|nr:MAG: glycosyltransferase [Lactobacillus sp.]
MYFFYDDNISFKKSGIEHAEIKRLRLFNEKHVPAKIITRIFSMNIHDVIADAGISEDQFVNLFDFFQGTMSFKPRKLTIEDLPMPKGYTLKPEKDKTKTDVYQGEQLVMIVGTRSEKDKRLDWVQYSGFNGRPVRMVRYDTRGFAALEQFYSYGTKLVSEQILNPEGQPVIQRFTHPRGDGETETSLHQLINYKGHDYDFATFEDLTTFWLDQLNLSTGEANTIICDRAYELAYSVQKMETPIYSVMYLHNNHVNSGTDHMHSSFNYNYEYMLENRKRWNGIATLTPWQYDDFTERFGKEKPNVYMIPGAVTDQKLLEKPHVKWTTRKSKSVIMVARLSDEKQQDILIQAWPKVIKAVPDATLDFWGYSNGDYDKTLANLVNQLGLNNDITFHDYTKDIGAVYDSAQLLILPSRAEGLPLTLVEAQAHGLPIVATDIKYGPRDVVNDGKDGYLVENRNVDQLADRIIELLSDPKKLETFSENAYKDSWNYSSDAIWQKWQPLIKDAKKNAKIPESLEV